MPKSWLPQFKHSDIEILSESIAYGGYCAIKNYNLRFRLFQGGWSKPIIRDVLCRASPEAVAVLLYDPTQDKVIMIEQLRLGALRDKASPWLLEIVAGVLDPGETPESTARIEAKEEANCDIIMLKHICNYYASPGISAELTHVYCGLIRIPESYLRSTEIDDPLLIHGLIEEGENIKCHVLETDEVLALLNQGKITSASAVIAVQWLALNRSSLNLTL